jgi:hypothetical protein
MLSYDDVRARISSLPLGKKLEVRFHYDDDPEVRTSFGMLDRIPHDGEQLFVLSVSCGRRKSEATPFFQNGIVHDLVRAFPKSHSRDRDDDDGLRPPARRQPPADDDFAPRPLPAAPAALAPSASSPAAVDAALLASIVAATVAAIRSSVLATADPDASSNRPLRPAYARCSEHVGDAPGPSQRVSSFLGRLPWTRPASLAGGRGAAILPTTLSLRAARYVGLHAPVGPGCGSPRSLAQSKPALDKYNA